ncbi:DUF3152 domain-containing protein [Streptomyces sp. NPDC052051]|uniref:DUF3152 domain-containing protein n=1 Tax=Streptomyces sp. NPDC052051 TaxID=3154649 RepID=UPI0034496273
MGRHSRKGRDNGTRANAVAAPGIPGTDPSAGDTRASATEATHARGIPRFPQYDNTGTHARGAQGAPVRESRGGHPEQREPGGGWGEFGQGAAPAGVRQGAPPGRRGPGVPGQRTQGGPRQEYLDAFDEDDDVFAPRRPRTLRTGGRGGGNASDGPPPAEAGGGRPKEGGKGRTFTGIAAAAVTTALAVVVAGQVADEHSGTAGSSQSVTEQGGDSYGSSSDDDGATPSAAPSATPLTYEQAMHRTYPLSATLKGPGTFDTVPGTDKVSGKGKYTYRVDVEKGLGLDGELFAQAVQRTLNDNRSWAHDETHVFERVSSGKPDFVVTLASPGTTAAWCAKSGLDTTQDNVSCDSASTERVMINAYRWARGSTTYGDKIYPYRQMLINHEVGHRLGNNHVTCQKDGQLAPVMQQQTKFLDHDGIHCLPNPWPYPKS